MKRSRRFHRKYFQPSKRMQRIESECRFETLEDRRLLAGVITQANPGYFATWDGNVPSTDVAGIAFEGGNLFLADSEINEIPEIFDGDNIFEVTTDGAVLVQEYTSGNNEPTGITFNEFDGYFYVTNDNKQLITRYDGSLDTPLATLNTTAAVPNATDPEGISSDPWGFLYVADGTSGGQQILVYDSTLAFQYSFSVSDRIADPEGIAFHADSNHLFILSGPDNKVFEYALNGAFVEEYDLNVLTPATVSAQGATFAPTSDINDPPGDLALYLADAGVDNSPDGGIYETLVSGAQLAQNTAPLVNAGSDQSITYPSFPLDAVLNAAAVDDGLSNPPFAVTTTWSQVSGPGSVSFGDSSAVDTTVSIPGSGTYVLRLTASDGEFVVSDDVTIDVSAGLLQVKITDGLDDAEETFQGAIQLGSVDLDVARKTVGLRFSGVDIPQGSTITNAFIQFVADETDSATASSTIDGHDIDDAPAFNGANINDITTRDRTASSVAWSPAAWTAGEAGANQQTPNIAAVIQDLVDRPGWTAGNALAIILSREIGKRAAASHDKSPALAPELFVDFTQPTLVSALTVEDVTELEGTGLLFTVTLDNATAAPFDVNVSFADVTATGGDLPLVTPEDYDNTAVMLNFVGNAGETQQFTVATLDDALVEGSETFTVNLSSTDPLVDDSDTAIGMITDSDAAALTVADVTELEGLGLLFTVTLDNATAAPFDVNVSFADVTATGGDLPLVTPEDYDNTAVMLNFVGNAGETQQFTVATLDDALVEGRESFTVNLSSTDPLVDDSDTAIGMITDSDAAAVTVADVTELEGIGLLFTVTLDNATAAPFDVNVSLADVTATGGDLPLVTPEDYDNTAVMLNFVGNAGETQQFTVATLDDALVEGSETFTVNLSSTDPLVDDSDTAIGMITDSDAAALTVADVTELEGIGLLFTVTLDNATAAPFDVNVSFADVTATGGDLPLVTPEDYDNTAVMLNFVGNAGETQQFTVATLDDALVEGSETFTVNLSSTDPLVDDSDTAIGMITDSDAAALTVADVTELEGIGLLFTVTLDNATAAPFDVNVSLADVTATGGDLPLVTPEDYDNTAVMLNFVGNAGETQQFTVATLDDALVEGSETFTVNLSSTDPLVDDSDTAIGMITDSDAAAVTVADVTELEGTGLLFTVTLDNATAAPFYVNVSLADVTATGGDLPLVTPEDYDNAAVMLNFVGNAGETQQFTVATLDDALVEGLESFTVNLSSTDPLVDDSDTAIGMITDSDAAALTVADVTELEGLGLLFTVTLDNATAAPFDVNVSFADVTATGGDLPLVTPEDYDNTAVMLNFVGNAGETQQFTVATLDDALVEGSETFTVNLSSTDPLVDDSDTAIGTIEDNDSTGGVPFETGIVTGVDNTVWTTVNVGQTYTSMVVVISPNYDSSTVSLVPRIRNVLSNSFDVQMQRTDGATTSIAPIDVHYLVVEEGVYTEAEHGVKMEAVTYTSTVTDFKESWVGEVQSYSNSYATPVVVGQVMSSNDPGFSAFWTSGPSRSKPPSSSVLTTGKHVGKEPNQTRVDELIGYIVIEAGSGNIDGRSYVASLGSDTVRGVDNAPPYNYSLTGLATAETAIVSQAGMDGTDGSWAILYGPSPLSPTNLSLAVDEGQASNPGRGHTTEQVAYLIFEELATLSLEQDALAVDLPSVNLSLASTTTVTLTDDVDETTSLGQSETSTVARTPRTVAMREDTPTVSAARDLDAFFADDDCVHLRWEVSIEEVLPAMHDGVFDDFGEDSVSKGNQ